MECGLRSCAKREIPKSGDCGLGIEDTPDRGRESGKKGFYSCRVGNTCFRVESRYQNLKYLGQGSYGTVCSAYDRKTDSVVAIKKITNVFKVFADAKRTLREVRLLQHLKGHANIVSLTDFTLMPIDGLPVIKDAYMMMQKWPCDLDRIISSSQPLSNQHLQRFLFQIVEGTLHMHRSGIAHRDLKPANLLVNSECDLVICDFGLSRSVSSSCYCEGERNAAPREGYLTDYVVTRWYRPPELLAENTQFPFAADVWSIGCILAELYRRRPLFPGTSQSHQMQLILGAVELPDAARIKTLCNPDIIERMRSMRKQTTTLSRMVQGANDELINFLERTLTFDPEQRSSLQQLLKHSYLSDQVRRYRSSKTPVRCFDDSFEKNLEETMTPKRTLSSYFFVDHIKFHPEDVRFIKRLKKASSSRAENQNPNVHNKKF